MKKYFSTLILFLLIQLANANLNYTIIEPTNDHKTPSDTIPYSIDEEELMSFNDSIFSLPAYGLYSEWDTTNIHFSKFNVAMLKDVTKEIALNTAGSCGYAPPFIGNITSSFGPRRRIFHYGVDIDLETGDAVGAAFDGKVRIAKKSKSYGNVVVIRHSNGLETYYAHLSKLKVEVGQEVSAGQIIGLGGNTGRSRGSHLHFEVRYLGQPINPNEIISFSNHKLISDTLCLSQQTFSYATQAKKTNSNYSVNSKGAKIYVIKKGDTLAAIARRYGTSTKSLCQKNGLKTTTILRLGQKIRI